MQNSIKISSKIGIELFIANLKSISACFKSQKVTFSINKDSIFVKRNDQNFETFAILKDRNTRGTEYTQKKFDSLINEVSSEEKRLFSIEKIGNKTLAFINIEKKIILSKPIATKICSLKTKIAEIEIQEDGILVTLDYDSFTEKNKTDIGLLSDPSDLKVFFKYEEEFEETYPFINTFEGTNSYEDLIYSISENSQVIPLNENLKEDLEIPDSEDLSHVEVRLKQLDDVNIIMSIEELDVMYLAKFLLQSKI